MLLYVKNVKSRQQQLKWLKKIICFSYNIFLYDRIKVVHFYERFEGSFKQNVLIRGICYAVEWTSQKLQTSLLVAGMVLVASPSSEINLK